MFRTTFLDKTDVELYFNYLFKETLPHLFHIQRFLFQSKFNDGAHEAGLREGALNAMF